MPPLPKSTDGSNPMRWVFDSCSDCDTCRFLMDESCLMFPELFRLYDQSCENRRQPNEDALRRLAELCTFCGLCPCPDIRTGILKDKAVSVRQNGLTIGARLLSDVQRIGLLCGLAPPPLLRLLRKDPIEKAFKSRIGIDPKRRLPPIPTRHFFSWAKRKGLDRPVVDRSPKVAYFAGCTAGYFFPEIAIAAVGVLERNGIAVHVPEQQCCGMPLLLEGDQETALDRMRFNLNVLVGLVREGYTPVCSCPTCGYALKVLLQQGACYSEGYQRHIQAETGEIRIPDRQSGKPGFVSLKKSMYENLLIDDGLFSGLDPIGRMELAARVQDVGEYLLGRMPENAPAPASTGMPHRRMVYFAPCHQREQEIGSPYETLLARIPSLSVQRVGSAMDCCGMGGSLGFKQGFSERSLALGERLFAKIRKAAPDAIVTDCISCRLQFEHALPYPVFHPLQVLAMAMGQRGSFAS
ncbi:heterodisulfide reductase-related iron-sulfur binding cluster [Desulfatirhabdium butyrativorans]|uniref:heterodisulfide reductase-related iron-sulfur binding cluster n=1 Tax=Desulfatirhabdium butyrativorans TaxID=340467 RepID=UPI00040B09AB|nr:heterodisulfide reductase-related iron-sulfur binding cluster [Desulfatirhabdium butyrativorans]